MDVYISKFWSKLPTIIQDIAEAEYVAVDFEMTGIDPPQLARLRQPTMAEIYQRAKGAAETFNIVQFGLTCVRFDEQQDCYVACSYNFCVSPMFTTEDGATKRLARMVDRTLVVSYSTMLFLRSNRIRIEDSYQDGIPYLSRAEEAEVRPQFLMTDTDQERDLIDLEAQDAETRAFYNNVREKLWLWEKTPDDGDYLNVANPHGGRMNRFQRRLVFQLLETEFPNKYFASVKGDYFMQILKDADMKEEERRKVKTKERTAALKSQIGLRYIIEALVGGDFAEGISLLLDPTRTVPSDSNPDKTISAQLEDSERKLKSQAPILIGHNMLYDLCFLYNTFIGPLPESIEGFNEAIHTLFPRIVDTKNLVTQGKHDMRAEENLEELYNEALKQRFPVITHARPAEYNRRNKTRPHHAGFDSSMTAILFLKRVYAMAQEQSHAAEETTRKLPSESIYPAAYANKIRVGNAGILHFGADGPSVSSSELEKGMASLLG